MKFSHQLILPAVASAALIQPRIPQDPKPITPDMTFFDVVNAQGLPAALKAVPVAKLVEVKTLAPKIRPDAKRTISKYGPYKLAGKNEPKPKGSMSTSLDPNGQAFIEMISEGLCKNCTLLSGAAGMEKLDGTVARSDSGVYLHHAVSYDTLRPADLPLKKCNSSSSKRPAVSLGAEFIAQGDDGLNSNVYYVSRDGKSNTGYHVGTDLAVLSQVDIVNSNEQSMDIYITFEVEYLEGHVGSDARVTLMSVTCNSPGNMDPAKQIKLDPNGPAITEGQVIPFTRDGRIVSASAHMHNGGDKMILAINNQTVCTSRAIYAPVEGTNSSTIAYNEPCNPNLPFKKGDNMVLTAVYDLKKHPLRAGSEHSAHGGADVMGMFYMTLSDS